MSRNPSNSTPLHQPTYGVRLDQEQIHHIVKAVFPSHKTSAITQLESGKSFNNRIYFIDIERCHDGRLVSDDPIHLVLKVSGRGFHHRKIENELGSLFLFRKFCPDLPVPQVVAWSCDGKSVETACGARNDSGGAEGGPQAEHAWVLMNRLPGRSMNSDDLDGPYREQLLRQVAGGVSMWRTLIPPAAHFGNSRLLERDDLPGSTTVFPDLAFDKSFCIGGLLLCTYYNPGAMASPLEYYTRCARDQVERLTKNHLLVGIKDEIQHGVEDFLSILPSVPVLQIQKPSTFTHFDLSPRNILVSETDPSQITGFLDFEFAGFFPEEEEFLNAQVRQADDWREHDWKALMGNLESLRRRVPPIEGSETADCFNEQHWKQLETVVHIIDNIAPWYIQEGAFSDVDLAAECKKASVRVQAKMRELQGLLTGNHR